MRGGYPSEDEQLVRPQAMVSLDQNARARRARDPGLYPLRDQPHDLLQVVRPLPGGGIGTSTCSRTAPTAPIGTRDRCPNALQRAWWPCGARAATVPGAWPTSWPRKASPSGSLASTGSCSARAWSASDTPGRARSPRATPWRSPASGVQIDVKYLPLLRLKGCPEPLRQDLYNAIDCSTRLQVAYVSSELTRRASVRFLQHLRRSFPFPIQEVQTDHDMEFTYVFFPHVRTPHPCRAGPR